jgi:sporulation protein YlmC with PRC-barrel domain
MSGFDFDDVPNWRGRDVIDERGYAVGVITDIYMDDVTGRPEWVEVKPGVFSHHVTFLPLSQATLHGMRVQVPYAQSHIHDAPHIDPHGRLSADEEARLYQHYGLDYDPASPSGADGEFIVPVDKADVEAPAGTREGGRLRLRRHVPAEQDPDRNPGD